MPDVMRKRWVDCYVGVGESFSNFRDFGFSDGLGMHIMLLEIIKCSFLLSKTWLYDTF